MNDIELDRIGCEYPSVVIIWPIMIHELSQMEEAYRRIADEIGEVAFSIYPLVADCWNADLSPWEFHEGNKDFAGHGKLFFEKIMAVCEKVSEEKAGVKIVLGGYSLAGLFSLWAGYESDCFHGIVSCSGSLWFPDFVDRYHSKPINAQTVYMSLGDREKRCRDRMMAEIEKRTLMLYDELPCDDKMMVMERGNHFTECMDRMIRGYIWILSHLG